MCSQNSYGLIGYNFEKLIGWTGIQSKSYDISLTAFYLSVYHSVKVLNQSLLNPHPFIKFASFLLEVFINVFYIEIFNAFTLPIQLFVKS